MSRYILAIDQGTSSCRAIIYDHQANPIASAQQRFTQYYPHPGWVEHDAVEIWQTQLAVCREVLSETSIMPEQLAGIGITNQRETTVIWHRETGVPVGNAIVWQDRRTAGICETLKQAGHADLIQQKTGLLLDACFSATKIQWILDNTEGARALADAGKLAFGTIDSWLVWNLTAGEQHITDASNASRTMLLNIESGLWDTDLLDLFDIPASLLADIVDSSGELAETALDLFTSGLSTSGQSARPIPICGIAGDQQAALFGEMCTEPGMLKNTYGTGCFLVLNTGDKIVYSKHQLLSTIAWKIGGKITYALEGSVFMGGATIQWLRDNLGIIKDAAESEQIARSVKDNGGVYFVPALTGLGSPHWDANARGSIYGLTRGVTAAHLTRAALEGICFQVNDVLQTMQKDCPMDITTLRVDGGAAANDFLMQFQADISNLQIQRPINLETTAYGAAALAGLALDMWDINMLKKNWAVANAFSPTMSAATRQQQLVMWNRSITHSLGWLQTEEASMKAKPLPSA